MTATDASATAVSLLEINAAAVHMEGAGGEEWDGDTLSLPVRVHQYEYGGNADLLGGPFDLVLCSDLIYLKISDEVIGALVGFWSSGVIVCSILISLFLVELSF